MPTPAIHIQRLSKRFVRRRPLLRHLLGGAGPHHVDALRDVSLRVERGEIFGLVGRNGQGKTTLIKSVCGLLEPSEGDVYVLGHHSVRAQREVKRSIGLVSADERSFYFRLTGRENLRFFGRLLSLDERMLAARIEELARLFELTPVLDRTFQEYSSGNKQRLALARALLGDPPLLLLDEPTRSLDPLSACGLRQVVSAWVASDAGKTVLITSHNLAEVEQLCGRVGILSRGALIACAPVEELKRRYLEAERVHLVLHGKLRETLVAQLRASAELPPDALSIEAEGESVRVALTRHAGDPRLDRCVRALLDAGLRLVSVQAEPAGLVEVLQRVEAEQEERTARAERHEAAQ
jgi:ABC-2 type transport system ATP-binding protein